MLDKINSHNAFSVYRKCFRHVQKVYGGSSYGYDIRTLKIVFPHIGSAMERCLFYM